MQRTGVRLVLRSKAASRRDAETAERSKSNLPLMKSFQAKGIFYRDEGDASDRSNSNLFGLKTRNLKSFWSPWFSPHPVYPLHPCKIKFWVSNVIKRFYRFRNTFLFSLPKSINFFRTVTSCFLVIKSQHSKHTLVMVKVFSWLSGWIYLTFQQLLGKNLIQFIVWKSQPCCETGTESHGS